MISGHTLDNRASVAALTVCLEELQNKPHVWDVWAVATVQEEVTFLGASSSAFALRPQIAIVVDGAFANGPGANGWQTFPMGKGVGLCIGPNMHPFLHTRTEGTGRTDLKFPGFWMSHLLTPARMHSLYRSPPKGFRPRSWNMPIRYMHTPVEIGRSQGYSTGRTFARGVCCLVRSRFCRYDCLGIKKSDRSQATIADDWRVRPVRFSIGIMPTFGNAQLKLLEKLCNVIAISGDESEVRKIVLEEVKPYADEVKVDALGNVLATRSGARRKKRARASCSTRIWMKSVS